MGNTEMTKINGGFVLVARKLKDSPVWGWSSDMLRLWVWILLSVNWRDDYERDFGGGVVVRKGQMIKSVRAIGEQAAGFESNNRIVTWSPGTVGRWLKKFEEEGMITCETTRLGTLITVCNTSYQAFSSYKTSELATPAVQSGDSQATITKHIPLEDYNIRATWDVYIEELGNPQGKTQYKLTDTRRRILKALWSEHLADSDNPLDLFRAVCRKVKASEWHSRRKSWLLPESFLRNPERRERWVMEALEAKPTSEHNVGRDWRRDG